MLGERYGRTLTSARPYVLIKKSCNTPYYLIILVSSGCLGIESPELCNISELRQCMKKELFHSRKNIEKLRANRFLVNEITLAISGDGVPKCGERLTAWESSNTLNT